MKNKQKTTTIKKNKLTEWEWESLIQGYNIADGHAHQEQSPEYLKIINDLPGLYLFAEKERQKDLQNEFEKLFFGLAGQKSYTKLRPPLYQYACSLSIEVVANYLRQTNKSVALLHPTFDNLADILKRHSVKMYALEENTILEPEKELKQLKADALFLVCPNNPTGMELTEQQYKKIVLYCKKYKKLLILDYSFRFFSSFTTWDQYELLLDSEIDFIILEDTGKTWPTLDLKIGITLASNNIYSYLEDITNDFLLNVSPFVFALLTRYILVEIESQSYQNAKKIVDENRSLFKKVLKDTPLKVENKKSKLSVEWVKLPKEWDANLFCKWIGENGVYALPGSPFFWHDPKRGNTHIRIALLRPKENFSKAIERLREAALAYKFSG